MDDKQSNDVADNIVSDYNFTTGLILQQYATKFWTRLARIEAEARLAEECQQCFGLGCPACEDNENEGE
jgi:hypothetical protein